MARKKSLGVGAVCTVFTRYMHPTKTVSDMYPNRVHNDVMEGLLVIRKEKKVVNRVEREVVVFRHNAFENVELHTVARWAKVKVEGPADKFFEMVPTSDPADARQENVSLANGREEEIPDHVFHLSGQAEDIAHVRGLGFEVDDDNDPAPENIPGEANYEPANNQDDPNNVKAAPEHWEGMCPRKSVNTPNTSATLRGVSEETIGGMNYITMFLLCLPITFIEEVVVEQTNKKIQGEGLTFGEFLRWVGLWLFMATTSGFSRREYFSTVEININSGAPYRLNCWMSKRRFGDILGALTYTKNEPPPYKDKFWEVRELIAAFNNHWTAVFKCSWVACLDESMSIWFNRWTCPGWMMVPRKPHPFGNEYHTINCGESGFVFGAEIQEGKDAPKERRHLDAETNKHGKTVGLLLRLCKPLLFTGKVVVLDSGFCVLRAIIELKKLGVFAAAVIKKRRYWPKHVDGNAMNEYMADKEIGETGVWQGMMDGVKYFYFMLKEPAWVMKMMCTYGDTCAPEAQEKTRRYYKAEGGETIRREFKYTTIFMNHFRYRHKIDDHNNIRHSVPALEETWITPRWSNRVFCFFLAVSEINAYLAYAYFVWRKNPKTFVKPTVHQFRRTLAIDLINNSFLEDQMTCGLERRKRKRTPDHDLVVAPKKAKKIKCGKWECTAKQTYQQYTCSAYGCTKRVRTYCVCSPGNWLCQPCHSNHIVWCATSEESGN